MGLQLSKELPNGVTGNYWHISKLSLFNDFAQIRLCLHMSKEAKDAGKTPLMGVNIGVALLKSAIIAGNVYELAYDKIKESVLDPDTSEETNVFVNALDV